MYICIANKKNKKQSVELVCIPYFSIILTGVLVWINLIFLLTFWFFVNFRVYLILWALFWTFFYIIYFLYNWLLGILAISMRARNEILFLIDNIFLITFVATKSLNFFLLNIRSFQKFKNVLSLIEYE